MKQLTALLIFIVAFTFGCDTTNTQPADKVEIRQFHNGELSNAEISINIDGQTIQTQQGYTVADLSGSSVSVTNMSPDAIAVNVRYLSDGESVFQKGATLLEGEKLTADY